MCSGGPSILTLRRPGCVSCQAWACGRDSCPLTCLLFLASSAIQGSLTRSFYNIYTTHTPPIKPSSLCLSLHPCLSILIPSHRPCLFTACVTCSCPALRLNPPIALSGCPPHLLPSGSSHSWTVRAASPAPGHSTADVRWWEDRQCVPLQSNFKYFSSEVWNPQSNAGRREGRLGGHSSPFGAPKKGWGTDDRMISPPSTGHIPVCLSLWWSDLCQKSGLLEQGFSFQWEWKWATLPLWVDYCILHI